MYIYDYVLLFCWFWWPATLCTVNGIGEMVSFDLGKKNRERCFSSCHERETKKNFWVPMRNWTSDLQSSVTEPQRIYYEVHMSHVLHTARTRNVDSVTADNFFFIPLSWQDWKHFSLSLCIFTWKFHIEDLMKMHFFLSRHSYQPSVK